MMLDARYALRGLRRNPGFAAVAVLVLALGLGANTAIFSVFHAVLLRPLPFRESDRLVMVWDQLSKLNLERFPAPFAHYYDYRDQNRVFEDLAAFSPAPSANLQLTMRASVIHRVRLDRF